MATVPTSLWQDILGQVRVSHPTLVRGWFSDLQPSRVDHGVIEILASNQAQSRYLEQHCQLAFTEAAQAATGQLVSVAFETDQQAEASGAASPSNNGYKEEQLLLNPDCTFDHFVTGPCNRLAHAAAVAVAEDLGRTYNPLFLYGPVGLGKTHLLQAICHTVWSRTPQARLHYISCETFINNFIKAVEDGALHQFQHRYRHVDCLVIDDVQFLAERERSQEEFFHTFNALYQSQRQIVLSADSSPPEIPSLEERLASRFNSGLVALLDRPCLETRMAIVRKKAKLRCIELPEPVIRLIAGRINTNIRDLEGAIIKLDALSQTNSGRVTPELAQAALGPVAGRPIPIPAILDATARRFGVKVSELQSKKRSKAITHPRHVCMFLARQLTSQSLEQIGGYFGGRDHTTVLHANRAIAQAAKQDAQLSQLLETIAAEVKSAQP